MEEGKSLKCTFYSFQEIAELVTTHICLQNKEND